MLFEKIRMCDLVVVGVALLEEGCPWEWILRLQVQVKASDSFCLPADLNGELSVPPQYSIYPHAPMFSTIVKMD